MNDSGRKTLIAKASGARQARTRSRQTTEGAGPSRAPERRGRGKTALITGASGGIGYELALQFARDGYDLVLVARSQDKLIDVANRLERDHGISARALPKDLTEPGAPEEIHSWLRSESIAVDVLVNNAGFGLGGLFADIALDGELAMLQVNLVGLTELTKLCLDGMLQRRSGKILNVASTAGFQPGPLMAVYYASKAYVLSFSEALANELKGTGVTVTTLAPGPTETGFADRAGTKDARLFQGHTMGARKVAEAGYRGLMRGRALVVPGLRNRLLAFAVRLTPRRVVVKITRRLQEART